MAVKCQIFSKGSGIWTDIECQGKVEDEKVKLSSKTLGTYRLLLVEEDPQAQLESECEMNPAPYAIVCTWFGLVILVFMSNILSKGSRKPELYRPANLGMETNRTVISTPHDKRGLSINDISEIEPAIMIQRSKLSSILQEHILVQIFKNQIPVDKVRSMVNLLNSMFSGFALLGALLYGDYQDNSNDSMSELAEEYYPEDMKKIFIALALVIPVVLPLRFSHKMNEVGKRITAAVTALVLLGCILGVLLMGAYFCQGAAMRWTLSYLIFIPLELAISEFIVSAIVCAAGRG
jgi:hypothetical protein